MRQTYRLWTYDLWGNDEDGYTVNDRYDQGTITIMVPPRVYNKGTAYRFVAFEPSDKQLNEAIGAENLSWDGESDYTLYATNANGDPVCELERVKERAHVSPLNEEGRL